MSDIVFNKVLQVHQPKGGAQDVKLDHMDSIKILRSLGMWTVEVQGQSTEYISPEEFAVLPEDRGTAVAPQQSSNFSAILSNQGHSSQQSRAQLTKTSDSSSSEDRGTAVAPQQSSNFSAILSNQGHSSQQSRAQLSKTSDSSSSEVWLYSKTILLIELYRDHRDDFKNPVLKKKEVWCRISKGMAEKGYNVAGELCDKKFRQLKNRYKSIRDSNHQTGQGRKRWEYFDIMDDVLAGDPSVRPALTISSLNGVTRNCDENCSEALQVTPQSTPTKRPASSGPPSSSKKRREAKAPAWLDQIITNQNDQIDRLEAVAKEYNTVQRERNDVLRELLNKL